MVGGQVEDDLRALDRPIGHIGFEQVGLDEFHFSGSDGILQILLFPAAEVVYHSNPCPQLNQFMDEGGANE
jgi:hypothetical protein